ncbi:MAG: type II toxin-antitoxin system VapC family toxin [Nitrospiraceae bacterium]
MTDYVVDASVAVKWFLPEVHTDVALRIRAPSYRLHIPSFFILEFSNILCKKIRNDEITRDQGDFALQELRNIPFSRHADESLLPQAFALANDTRRSLYDSLYVALAIAIDGKVVTADRKLVLALQNSPYAAHLCWIEDLA